MLVEIVSISMTSRAKDRRWKQIHLRIPVEGAEEAAEAFLLAGVPRVLAMDNDPEATDLEAEGCAIRLRMPAE